VIRAGTVSNRLVQNLDFAPTFLSLAGLTPSDSLQGISMLDRKKRDALYYHYYEYPDSHRVRPHYGIRTDRYKLIHFYDGLNEWELYDLDRDPKEMNNVFSEPRYSKVVDRMTVRLRELQQQYGDP